MLEVADNGPKTAFRTLRADYQTKYWLEKAIRDSDA
jgi:hypothetical protein